MRRQEKRNEKIEEKRREERRGERRGEKIKDKRRAERRATFRFCGYTRRKPSRRSISSSAPPLYIRKIDDVQNGKTAWSELSEIRQISASHYLDPSAFGGDINILFLPQSSCCQLR
jgi:hypothetical protein